MSQPEIPEPIRRVFDAAAASMATQDRQAAFIDARSHEVITWLLALDAEGAAALRDLLFAVRTDPKDFAALQTGRFIGMLEVKLASDVGRCPVCSANHEELLQQMAQPDVPRGTDP